MISALLCSLLILASKVQCSPLYPSEDNFVPCDSCRGELQMRSLMGDWPPKIEKYFEVEGVPKSWHGAYRYCMENGGRLARVESAEQNFKVVDLIINRGGGQWYWVGGNDLEEEGNWKWLLFDDNPVVFDNWWQGEPNNGEGEDCMLTDEAKWNDAKCWLEYPFICEYYSIIPYFRISPTTDL